MPSTFIRAPPLTLRTTPLHYTPRLTLHTHPISSHPLHPAAGACGGETACSTCHVILAKDVFAALPEMSEAEEDMLDLAAGLKDTSRLGCQVRRRAISEEMAACLWRGGGPGGHVLPGEARLHLCFRIHAFSLTDTLPQHTSSKSAVAFSLSLLTLSVCQ